MPASRALLLAPSQPRSCGPCDEVAPESTCGAVVEMVIIAVAPDPPTVSEVGFIVQVICALIEAGWHERPTVPLKPELDSTTIRDVADWPGVEIVAEYPKSEKSGLGVSAAQAFAKVATFNDPNPVT